MLTKLERRVNELERRYIFNYTESKQIVDIIMESEGLTKEQAQYYDFVESYENHGTVWIGTIQLAEYVNNLDNMTNTETIKAIMNTPTLHLLTTGMWIGWKY